MDYINKYLHVPESGGEPEFWVERGTGYKLYEKPEDYMQRRGKRGRTKAAAEESKTIEIEFDGSWLKGEVVKDVPSGTKVRFDVDGTTSVVPAAETNTRIRPRSGKTKKRRHKKKKKKTKKGKQSKKRRMKKKKTKKVIKTK
jgi:hypothetical protein